MLVLIFLIDLLIISITKSEESCDVSTNSETLFKNKINITAFFGSCLGNLKDCQNGIETKDMGKPMSISKNIIYF